ncbi:MAG TPA: TlpA family protein disulfide reductase [Gammaproteobacteria bacterium]|nr:TlpA family protein disulfide reductase [Gammaproteobacteria bacterium]HIL98276.1 TlpA family protein disulfide reductase [Pseudomonadales bacterium]
MRSAVYSSILLMIMISQSGAEALPTHITNESYDGSIGSFRWLKSPIDVGEVLIRNEQGEHVALTGFSGKIVLLNLWASWCAPCIKELPALDRMQQRLGGDDFVIVAVSLDSDIDLARQMFTRLSIQSMALYTESAESLGRHFPLDVLPTSVVIDRDGQAMGLLRSSLNWDDPEVDSLVNRLIAGVSAATFRAEKAQ